MVAVAGKGSHRRIQNESPLVVGSSDYRANLQ
jgi:hypothetical protein